MKVVVLWSLGFFLLVLTSCGSRNLPLSALSKPERELLRAVNRSRIIDGKKALFPSVNLTEMARQDARRRVSATGGDIDHRQKTGYERMLTLAGKAAVGPGFEESLMSVWQRNPIQRSWLAGDYAGVGVGTASGANGMQAGVLLLGGFAEDGI